MDSAVPTISANMAEVISHLRSPVRPRVENTQTHPFLSIGFRPFFFLASVLAVLWVPLWLHLLAGGEKASSFPILTWHAHEMLFGFTGAVIAGFLLTAASNWTGQRTVTGTGLLALSLLWLSARILLLIPTAPSWLVFVVDLAFFPAVALVLARPLVATKNVRNFPFLVMLALLVVANGLMHLEVGWGGSQTLRPGLGTTLALRTITLMMLVMGGRVIPMFTKNATQAPRVGPRPLFDRVAIGAFLAAAFLTELVSAPGVVGSAWFVVGALHLIRMKSWGTRHARAPLLWILHAGYSAIALSFLLEGAAVLGWVLPSAATHLLTVGGIGGLCLGMMTRVSLGHSGRMLVAPRRMTTAFAFLVAAALTRVFGPLFFSRFSFESYFLSGALWSLAFLLLLTFGAEIWFSPRADERKEHRS